jgi:uncharacterized protein
MGKQCARDAPAQINLGFSYLYPMAIPKPVQIIIYVLMIGAVVVLGWVAVRFFTTLRSDIAQQAKPLMPVHKKDTSQDCTQRIAEEYKVPVMKPVGWVNDFEQIFSEAEETTLTQQIDSLETATQHQMAIVTIDSAFGSRDVFDNFTRALANCWGVGRKEANDGMVIVFGKRQRFIRIEVGRGLTEKLTNAETKSIIDRIIIPAFKKQDYFGGMQQGIRAISKEVAD